MRLFERFCFEVGTFILILSHREVEPVTSLK